MLSDNELEARLQATRAANPGDSHTSYMQEAWLLIALRRQEEGVAMARRAQEVWSSNRAKQAKHSLYGGSLYWDPWIAEAAVALAEGSWRYAEECARTVLTDFDEEDAAHFLLELALQAQGRLSPERMWVLCKDPVRELADFDLRAYALRRARLCADWACAMRPQMPDPVAIRELSRAIFSAARAVGEPVALGLDVYNSDERVAKELGLLYESVSFYIALARRLAPSCCAADPEPLLAALDVAVLEECGVLWSGMPAEVQQTMLAFFQRQHASAVRDYVECRTTWSEDHPVDPESLVGRFAHELIVRSGMLPAEHPQLLRDTYRALRTERCVPRVFGLLYQLCSAAACAPAVAAQRQQLADLAAAAAAAGRGHALWRWWRDLALTLLAIAVRTRGWQVGLGAHWTTILPENSTCLALNGAFGVWNCESQTDATRAQLIALCTLEPAGDAVSEATRILSRASLAGAHLSSATARDCSLSLLECVCSVAAEFDILGIRRDPLPSPRSGEPDLELSGLVILQPYLPRPGQEVHAALQHCAHLAEGL
jgi:hypothetical protein